MNPKDIHGSEKFDLNIGARSQGIRRISIVSNLDMVCAAESARSKLPPALIMSSVGGFDVRWRN
jgi:hypothetical protein